MTKATEGQGEPTGAVQPSGAADGRNRVAIFGGGPGGLSAALELVERGFDVDLYERHGFLGGKSRTETVVGSGTGGRKDLPIESGPHVYWGTYPHWNDTMSRVPSASGEDSLIGNLISYPVTIRKSVDRKDVRKEFLSTIKVWELPRLMCKVFSLATSGLLRQHHELEHCTLSDYTGPVSRQSFELLALVISQIKVDPDLVSARATARNLNIFSGYLGTKGLGQGARRVMNVSRGPADEAIFNPFGRHLEKQGVRIHLHNELLGFESSDRLITAANVRDAAGELNTIEADWYILAIPQDKAPNVLNAKLIAADPRLGRLDRLGEQWLGAANLILKGPAMAAGLVAGPWQIAVADYSATMTNFGERYGDGTATQWISVDLETWDYPGLLYGKTAKECTKEEFFEELLAHLSAVYPNSWGKLNRDHIIRWDVSPLLKYETGQQVVNDEKILGVIPGTWSGQPNVVTAIDNLFIGATYARTTGGIDSMDGACEAARRAVNSILDKTGTSGARIFVDTFEAKGWLKKLWDYDDRRYRKGLPNVFDRIRPFRGGQPWRDELAPSQHDSEWPENI